MLVTLHMLNNLVSNFINKRSKTLKPLKKREQVYCKQGNRRDEAIVADFDVKRHSYTVVPLLKIAHSMYFHNIIKKIFLIALWSGSNSRRNNGFTSKFKYCIFSDKKMATLSCRTFEIIVLD